jgi:hypothetical protein
LSGVWQKNEQNGPKNEVINEKMAAMNTLEHKHPENEAKMHFTYLQQCLAHSSTPSRDFMKLLLQVHSEHIFEQFTIC